LPDLRLARPVTQAELDAGRFALLARVADDIAHEIKNPLHSMVINLEVLKRRVEKGASAGALERAEVLSHELERLHVMVEALLRLIRPGKPPSGALSLRETMESVLPLVALRFRLGRVDFSHDPVPEEAYTEVPPDALCFALLALTEWALDRARAGGGAVRLTCELGPKEIGLGITLADTANSAPGPGPSARGERLDSSALARALLEPAGATLQWNKRARGSGDETVVISIPRTDYRIENRS
jgi:signal transduction histidine kinase